MVGNTKVSKKPQTHGLLAEGAGFRRVGRGYGRTKTPGVGGPGFGKCACGEVSPEILPSGNQRKAWHREHKATVSA